MWTDQEWFDSFKEARDQRQAAGPSDAYRAFMVNKPNPPEHADFMKRAAELYPNLPPGAQQNALWASRNRTKGEAQRYVRNARSRQDANERALMGTTLAAWRNKVRADVAAPYHFDGVISTARRKVYQTCAARYAAWIGRLPEITDKAFRDQYHHWREVFAAERGNAYPMRLVGAV